MPRQKSKKPSKSQKFSLPEVRIKPSSYQPTKAELEEVVSFDTTPEEFLRRVPRPMKIVRDPNA